MNDLISRRSAIKAFDDEKYDNPFCGEYEVGYNDGIDFAVSTLSDLPSAQPKPRWIPVTERLPEKNGRYLVTRGLSAGGDMWNRVYIINYSDLMGLKSKRIWWYGNVGKSDFVRVEDVIAWMPLFEPYREETEDDND